MDAQQRNDDASEKLDLVVAILIEYGHLQHGRHVLDVAAKTNITHFIPNIHTTNSTTYNVKILFQFGISVLYSVCVCSRELISSSTQNGSDLPPKSAATNPVAPNTFTVR